MTAKTYDATSKVLCTQADGSRLQFVVESRCALIFPFAVKGGTVTRNPDYPWWAVDSSGFGTVRVPGEDRDGQAPAVVNPDDGEVCGFLPLA